jgi:hypothetical protein
MHDEGLRRPADRREPMIEHDALDQPTEARRAPSSYLRASILEMIVLVAALAISFRWPGLAVPAVFLFLYALDRRRNIVARPTRAALGQVALVLYIPPTLATLASFLMFREDLDDYLTHFSFMANFIPGTILAHLLPWFDRMHAPHYAGEAMVLSTLIDLAMIAGLGVLAARGQARRIACLVVAASVSAASTYIAWLIPHLSP